MKEKKESISCNIYFILKSYLYYLYFISICSVLNKLSEYIFFSQPKNIISHLFLLPFEILKTKYLT